VSGVVATSLGLVFLLAGIGKLRHPRGFIVAVRNYEILPKWTVLWLALGLIGVECFLAVAFLTGLLLEVASLLAAVTLSTFMLAVTVNLSRHHLVECACFGDPQERISTRTVSRLCLLLLGAFVVLIAAAEGQRNVDTALRAAAGDLGYGLEIVALGVAVDLVAMWFLGLPQVVSAIRWSSTSGARLPTHASNS